MGMLTAPRANIIAWGVFATGCSEHFDRKASALCLLRKIDVHDMLAVPIGRY
jgi:hypothetical protein